MLVPHAGSAFASTASMDIPAGDMPQQSMSQSSLDSDDFDDESTVFLTAPKVNHSCLRFKTGHCMACQVPQVLPNEAFLAQHWYQCDYIGMDRSCIRLMHSCICGEEELPIPSGWRAIASFSPVLSQS